MSVVAVVADVEDEGVVRDEVTSAAARDEVVVEARVAVAKAAVEDAEDHAGARAL